MDPVAVWLSLNPDPAASPATGMREAGLLQPISDYLSLARLKATIVQRTGLLGLASVWGGRQLIYRHFLSFGTEAQRARWAGHALAVAISEPGVGAHPKHLTTRADPTAGGYRISGRKAWVSNATEADAIIVFAITAQEASRKRYSAFIVPRDTAGLTWQDMPGFHALRPSRHVLLTLDCEVAPDACLGESGTAYERMALPFRDIEDAVGTFAILGAVRHALEHLRTHDRLAQGDIAQGDIAQGDIAQGEIAALAAVFAAAADDVVGRLDAGRFRPGDAVVAGLRVLARDLTARLRSLAPDLPILGDLDAVLSIAPGPHAARLRKLAGEPGAVTESPF